MEPAAAKIASFDQIEHWVQSAVEWLRLSVELLGAFVIAVGVLIALKGLVQHLLHDRSGTFAPIRLSFARYLMMALELQLAADILSTSIAPTWDRIGKLGAIAVIRTALNYFLSREMSSELAAEARSRQSGQPMPDDSTPARPQP